MSLTKDRNEAKYRGQPVFVDLLRSSPRNERVALSKFHAASRKLLQCHSLPPIKRVVCDDNENVFLLVPLFSIPLSKILNIRPLLSSDFHSKQAFLKSYLLKL